jgi:cysteine synthase A
MKGAIDKAKEIADKDGNYFMPQQFDNLDNAKAHYDNTAVEILRDLPKVDYFVAGVGTGGTIAGVGKKIKEELDQVKVIAVEPKKSPVISGGKPGPHKIQGIGAGFVTKIYDESVVDEIVTVDDEEAYIGVREAFEKVGLFVGISTGANIYAAVKLANSLPSDKIVVTIMPDGGEKYLSVGVF